MFKNARFLCYDFFYLPFCHTSTYWSHASIFYLWYFYQGVVGWNFMYEFVVRICRKNLHWILMFAHFIKTILFDKYIVIFLSFCILPSILLCHVATSNGKTWRTRRDYIWCGQSRPNGSVCGSFCPCWQYWSSGRRQRGQLSVSLWYLILRSLCMWLGVFTLHHLPMVNLLMRYVLAITWQPSSEANGKQSKPKGRDRSWKYINRVKKGRKYGMVCMCNLK